MERELEKNASGPQTHIAFAAISYVDGILRFTANGTYGQKHIVTVQLLIPQTILQRRKIYWRICEQTVIQYTWPRTPYESIDGIKYTGRKHLNRRKKNRSQWIKSRY